MPPAKTPPLLIQKSCAQTSALSDKGKNAQTFQKYNPPAAAWSFPNKVPETQTQPDAYQLFLCLQRENQRMPTPPGSGGVIFLVA